MNKVQFPGKNTVSLSSLEGALISTVKTSDPETFQNTFLVTTLKKKSFWFYEFSCKSPSIAKHLECSVLPSLMLFPLVPQAFQSMHLSIMPSLLSRAQ